MFLCLRATALSISLLLIMSCSDGGSSSSSGGAPATGGGGGGGGSPTPTPTPVVAPAAGTFDTSFGSTGYVLHDAITGSGAIEYANTVAALSGGGAIAAGISTSGGNETLAIWKYTSTGALDTTFSGNGTAYGDEISLCAGGGSKNIYRVTVDSFDRIYLAGYCGAAGMVARLTSTGSLDASFATGGVYFYYATNPLFYDMKLLSDGSVIAAGQVTNTPEAIIVKLTSAGALDTSFDSDGIRQIGNIAGTNGSSFHGVDVKDEKIYLTGEALNASSFGETFVLKLNADGSTDTSFATSGLWASTNGTSMSSMGERIAVGADGAIYVGGRDNSAGKQKFNIFKVTAAGVNDNSFAGTGKFIYSNPLGTGENAFLMDLAVTSSGLVYGAGYQGQQNAMVFRLTAAGVLDSSFATGGAFTISSSVISGSTQNNLLGMALTSTGAVFATGFCWTTDRDMCLIKIK